MPDAAELAFKNLERVLSRDPMLRDVLEQTVPKSKRGVGSHRTWMSWLGSMYRLDMPGIPKELNVELQGAQLIVTGKKPNHHPEHAQVVSSERQSGTFKRVFLLPTQVQPNGVTADLSNGVLTIEIPKAGDGSKTTIPIR